MNLQGKRTKNKVQTNENELMICIGIVLKVRTRK